MHLTAETSPGAEFRARRRVLGLSAEKVARLAGVSMGYLFAVEHGRECSPKFALKVDTALRSVEEVQS